MIRYFFEAYLFLYLNSLWFALAFDFKCLPSQASNSCFICGSNYFPKDPLEMDGVNAILGSDCLEKQNEPDYRRKVYVTSEKYCSKENICDGSIDKPYDDLLVAMLEEWKTSGKYMSSELEFNLIGAKHFLSGNNALGKVYIFRRNYAGIIIKPLYCFEILLDGCFNYSSKPIIRLGTPLLQIYVSKYFVLRNLTLDGIDILNNFRERFSPPESIEPRGLINIERIIENADYDSPFVEVTNCELINIYGLGPIFSENSIHEGFSSFINIENNWGSRILINGTTIQGGFFSDGFIRQSSAPDYFYNSIDKAWLIDMTNESTYRYGAIFHFENNNVSNYDLPVIYDIAQKLYNQPVFFIKVHSNANDPGMYGDIEIMFQFSGNNVFNFINQYFSADTMFLFEGNSKSNSILYFTRNTFYNNSCGLIVYTAGNVAATVIFIGNRFSDNKGTIVRTIDIDIIFKDNNIKNNFIFDHLFSIERACLDIESSKFFGLFSPKPNNEIRMTIIKTSPYPNMVLSEEFNTPASKNSSDNLVVIENSSFEYSNTSLLIEDKYVTLVRNLFLINSSFTNFTIELDGLIRISVENRLKIMNTSFQLIDCLELIILPFSRNIEIFQSAFDSIIGTVFKVYELAQFSNNSLICNIQSTKFSNVLVFFYHYIFMVFSTRGSSYIDVQIINCEARNISSDLPAQYLASSVNWVFSFSTSQVVTVKNVSFSELYFCSAFFFNHDVSSNLPYYHSSVLVEGLSFSNSHAFSLRNLKISNHRQIFLQNLTVSSVFLSYGINIITQIGSIFISDSTFNSSASLGEGLLTINVNNATCFFMYKAKMQGNLESRTSSGLYFSTKKAIGADILDMYFRNSKEEANLPNITGFLRMPKEFGLKDCEFSLTISYQSGLIVLLTRSEIVVYNCSFFEVGSLISGGAIYSKESSRIYINHSNFNSCFSSENGGCIVTDQYSTLICSFSDFVSGRASYGSAIFSEISFIVLFDCTFFNSSATIGGAIVVFYSHLNISNSLFSYCRASQSGGCLSSDYSFLILTATKFYKCQAGLFGSVIFLNMMEFVYIYNVLIEDCAANQKGGVYALNKNDIVFNIYKIFFLSNKAGTGSCCLYVEEGTLNLYLAYILDNIFSKNVIEVSSSFSFFTMKIIDSRFAGNSCENEIIRSTSCILNIQNSSVLNNTSHTSFIYAEYSNITVFSTNIQIGIDEILKLDSPKSILLEKGSIRLDQVNARGQYFSGFLYARDSEVEVLKCNISYFQSTKGSAVFIFGISQLRVVFSDFNSNIVVTGGVIHAEDGLVEINDTSIRNNNNSHQASDFFAKRVTGLTSLKVSINRVTFISCTNTNFVTDGIRYLNLKLLSFDLPMNITKLDQPIKIINAIEINIELSKFYNKTSLIINSKDLCKIFIKNSVFSGCQFAGGAGALSIIGKFEANIMYCSFLNNTAKKRGAGLYLDCASTQCTVKLTFCFFMNNSAGACGGAISFASQMTYFLDNNEFINNSASVGDDINGFPSGFFVYQGEYEVGLIVRLYSQVGTGINNSAENTLISSSGQRVAIIVIICDDFSNFLTYISDGIIKIIEVDNKAIIEGNEAIVSNGYAIFNNLFIVGQPNTTINLAVNYKFKHFYVMGKKKMFLRACQRGEIYSNNMCIPCEYGFYSLNYHSFQKNINYFSCELCPRNADCLGRDIILPNEGYFRLHSESTKLIICQVKLACPAQLALYESIQRNSSSSSSANSSEGILFHKAPFYQQICQKGYTGNLCNRCEKSFSKIAEGFCIECSESSWYLMEYLLLFLASSCFMNLQGILALDFQESESKKRSLLKIIINHSYFLISIGRFKIDWGNEIFNYLKISDLYLASVPKELFSYECLISPFFKAFELDLVSYIISFFQPFIFVILCFIIRMITLEVFLYFKARGDFYKGRINSKIYRQMFRPRSLLRRWWTIIKILWLICMYNLYPRNLQNALELLKCISLDDTQTTFMEKYPDYICWESDEHRMLLYIGFLPNFFIWGIMWPLFLYYVLKKKNDSIIRCSLKIYPKKHSSPRRNPLFDSPMKILRMRNLDKELTIKHKAFKFLIMDYNFECYYWEIVFYCSYLIISTTLVITSKISTVSQGGCFISLFLLFLIVVEAKQPFKYAMMNQMQACSYLILILTTALSILANESFFTYSRKKKIFQFSIFVLNCSYYFIWLILYLKALALTLRGSLLSNYDLLMSYIRKVQSSFELKRKRTQKPSVFHGLSTFFKYLKSPFLKTAQRRKINFFKNTWK